VEDGGGDPAGDEGIGGDAAVTKVELGSLFQFIRNGMNVKQDKSGEGLPITRIETISNAVVDPNRVGYAGLTEGDAENWLLEEGDILFSHINSVQHIGKCAVYRGQPSKLVHGMNLLCLRSDRTKLSPEFAKYLLRSGHFRARLSNCIKKAVNQASVSIGDLQAIPVTVPPLPEQRRIAEILDRAEALRAKRRASLAQLEVIIQAFFLDMFGEPFANRVDAVRLIDVAEVLMGQSPPGSSYNTKGKGTPLLNGPTEFGERYPTEKQWTTEPTRVCEAGDILFCVRGATAGRLNRADKRYCLGRGLAAIRPRAGAPVSVDFLFAVLDRYYDHFQAKGVGSTFINIGRQELESLPVPRSKREDADLLSRRVGGVEQLRAAHRSSAVQLDALFSSLQQRAFRGEL
jgi:type I restriction enzyme S subunit